MATIQRNSKNNATYLIKISSRSFAFKGRLVKKKLQYSENDDPEFPFKVRVYCENQSYAKDGFSCTTKLWMFAKEVNMESPRFFELSNWRAGKLESKIDEHMHKCLKNDALEKKRIQYSNTVSLLNRNQTRPKTQRTLRAEIQKDSQLTSMERGNLFTQKQKRRLAQNSRKYERKIKAAKPPDPRCLEDWMTVLGK